jgi:hypothetical protein
VIRDALPAPLISWHSLLTQYTITQHIHMH